MNHPTQCIRITILQLVLAGLVLLFSVPALFADGIASRYPNDVGIENDPDVILADGFESYTSPSQLTTVGSWDLAAKQANLRIATEPGNYVGGHKSLEIKSPISAAEVVNGIVKRLTVEQPVLYVRAYIKFDLGWNLIGHSGIKLAGNAPGSPGNVPPRDRTGFFIFLLQNDKGRVGRGGENYPGFGQIYAYWPFQRTNFGDHWFSDGWVVPYSPVCGNLGDWLCHPAQYPDFRVMPNWQPLRGLRYCYEYMVKINTLGSRDGEVAF